jgi:hypothetical protein
MKLSIRTRYFAGYPSIEGTAGWTCCLVDEPGGPTEHANEVTCECLGFDTEEEAREYAQAQVEALRRGVHASGGTVADIPTGTLSWRHAEELIHLGGLR